MSESTIGPGWRRIHLDEVGSTNDEARRLAGEGAPHGTVVTADHQSDGRGRQGRAWVVPPGQALTASIVVRDAGPLLPLAAAIAVAETAGPEARIKWPNDVLLPVGGDLRKVAGILAEGRPAEGWAVVGIGLNVAVELDALPPEVAATAATLGRSPAERDAVLDELTRQLDAALALDAATLLERWSARDALRGSTVRWETPGGGDHGEGVAEGIGEDGRLLIRLADGDVRRLDAGDVHLVRDR
ncbi:biotin--[acetyl-CoA-carboxylase] ligase [Patulibacter defluvii]|uniref:biotin--[acetyl-CoA-carboxylase] ligase n=1 Tax=Patulibacter defluvii TaxID=3095358 RepID=UPI002A759EB5|nr:biotin--[acetyl-CoA-carboxylase] ligase [Patulibacter sp. DM4]